MDTHILRHSLEQLKLHHKPIKNVNHEHQKLMKRADNLALWITSHVGTMGFFIIIFVWTLTWMLWNLFAPEAYRFDPFPGLILWLLISNVIQIFLMPLIMIGQNLQGQHSELRAENDYEVNLKAKEEIEAILVHLEHQNSLILEILNRMEKSV